MKLELKHLAPYLPYNVNVKVIHRNRNYKINSTKQLSNQLYSDYFLKSNTIFKPILRPLCDLQNKEHENRKVDCEYIIEADIDIDLSYYEWCYLLENHFDVFGLIKKGLAIDINTI